MQTISTNICQRTMYSRGIPVFQYKISYPCFHTTYNIAAARKINQYYSLYAQNTEAYARTVLFPQAADNAKFIPRNEPPFISYEFLSEYQAAYNKDCIVSLYTDRYEFMGGAHGSTTRQSETWNFKTCARLKLEQFFPHDPSFPENTFREIESQISVRQKETPSSYFDDYAVLLRKNFHPENFYLSGSGIVIYYQQYDIAPYSTGIPEFLLFTPSWCAQ